jgi:DNA-binding NtrC family response regulator/ferredoxin
MQVIFTDKNRCRKSYACIRVCPVNAIRVQDDGTVIAQDRCILCGNCVDACSQGAIRMVDTIPAMEECLSSEDPAALLLDPDWPITVPGISPDDLEAALKKSGFTDVRSSFLAIEYVFQAYEKVMGQMKAPIIGSLCQIVSTYVEKHAPSLIPNMAPVVTPAIATARYLRAVTEKPVKVVLATSCLATKAAPGTADFKGDFDAVVTLRELKEWLTDKTGLSPTAGPYDYRSPLLSGARYRMIQDFLSQIVPGGESPRSRILAVSGAERALDFLEEVRDGDFKPGLAVVKYCSIDADSHAVDSPLTLFQREDLMARVVEEAADVPVCHVDKEISLDLDRVFKDRSPEVIEPTPAAIQQVLDDLGMYTPEDELDCGACGFPTCREKARTVNQGLAKLEMCLPYLIRQLSSSNEELTRKYQMILKQLDETTTSSKIIGTSPEIQLVRHVIARVAPTPTTVLIRGESGTGKELVARAIHKASDRAEGPFVAINCTAIAESLLDSELFGHVRGAFTSATSDKKGLFEEADGGTLFLDEIGDVSMELQSKLLRTLDSGEIRRVGESPSRKVDVRLIAATNRDLEKAIGERHFREDLFYRLSTFTISMPPLRERKEDIPLLAEHLLEKAGARVNKQVHGISNRSMGILRNYHWPGNVRELENVIERAVVLVPPVGIRILIEPEHLPKELWTSLQAADLLKIEKGADYQSLRERSVGEVEKKLLVHYLNEAEGNVSKASVMAGIPRRTFYRMMTRLNIKAREVVNKT